MSKKVYMNTLFHKKQISQHEGQGRGRVRIFSETKNDVTKKTYESIQTKQKSNNANAVPMWKTE